MNFYCNVVDDRLRHRDDQSTIGLILCQDKNKIIAEYALKNMRKAIGVSEYELTRALPASLKSSLPSIAEVEAELARSLASVAGCKTKTRAPRRSGRNDFNAKTQRRREAKQKGPAR